jgi:polygalacturonase
MAGILGACHLLPLLLLAAAGAALAADGSPLPWPLRGRAAVASGARVVDVAVMGARADNRTDNSRVFASALRELKLSGGGTLLVPKGGVYLTLPLNLTASGTRLRVEAGATLKALCDSSRWPVIRTLPSYGGYHGGSSWFAPFIGAFGVHDIILEGGGTIDGSGECFWGPRSATTTSMNRHGADRGNLLLFEKVRRAELSGLRFTNSPFWTLHRPGPPGCLSALSVSLYKSVFYGIFVWARRALNSQK